MKGSRQADKESEADKFAGVWKATEAAAKEVNIISWRRFNKRIAKIAHREEIQSSQEVTARSEKRFALTRSINWL
jgi:hypothetical protein